MIKRSDRGRVPHFFAKRVFRPFKRLQQKFALAVPKLPEGALQRHLRGECFRTTLSFMQENPCQIQGQERKQESSQQALSVREEEGLLYLVVPHEFQGSGSTLQIFCKMKDDV